jgi:hypothetical protein
MVLAVFGLGLLASQAGHLLAYQIRFGAAAQQVQSSGAHTYFPLVAKTALGAVASALVAGLLLVGLVRVLSGQREKAVSSPSYLSLLAFLFSIQLTVFAAQEIAEGLITHSTIGSAPQLLLWGTLGQLPIAVVAALALCWLTAHIESAVGAIREVVRASIPKPRPAPVAILNYTAPDRALLVSFVARSPLGRRGPPSSLRISSY